MKRKQTTHPAYVNVYNSRQTSIYGACLRISAFGFLLASLAVAHGAGLNPFTTFSVLKGHVFSQTNAAMPVKSGAFPYVFQGGLLLISNRTADSVTMTIPGGSLATLANTRTTPNNYSVLGLPASAASLDASYPAGDYVFHVASSAFGDQTVSVTLPATMSQPNPPHVVNYTAAQSVNPTQPFMLMWESFAGGTADDGINVQIGVGGGLGGIFKSTLTGTATSVEIPAGTLIANFSYTVSLAFYHSVTSSNSSYLSAATRESLTQFNLTTTPSAPVLASPGLGSGDFSFDIQAMPGKTVTVLYTTNLSATVWQTLLTTNPVGNQVHIRSPLSNVDQSVFFRVRLGP